MKIMPREVGYTQKWSTKTKLGKCMKVKSSLNVHASVSTVAKTIDTLDRPLKIKTQAPYLEAKTYNREIEDKSGKRIPASGFYAEAGVGSIQAEYSILDADVKGPNVSVGVETSALGVSAMARAELIKASASVGPVNAKLGLSVETGVAFGPDVAEVKFLGTGASLGPDTSSVSVLGNEVECVIQ